MRAYWELQRVTGRADLRDTWRSLADQLWSAGSRLTHRPGGHRTPSDRDSTMALPWVEPLRTSSICTSTRSTRSSTERVASRRSWRRPRASRCRPSSLTDHGSLAGAVELYREARKRRREADHRLRGVRRGRPSSADEGLRASHAPRRVERGLREPHQALLARLPRGLLLQAARRLGAPRATRERDRGALGLPVGTCVAGALGGQAEGRAHGSRPPRPDLRTRLDVRRAAERRPRRAAADQPRPHRARGGDRPSARRDR